MLDGRVYRDADRGLDDGRAVGGGAGGAAMVKASSLTVQNRAQIASTTAGPGNGGVVQITGQGRLSLIGGGGSRLVDGRG